MRLIPVVINGKIHRLSERALELLNLEKIEKDQPIAIQKLPPNLDIIKIEKVPKQEIVKEVPKEAPKEVVEVKKKEDAVTVVKSEEPKKRRRRGTVGAKK